MKYLNGPSILVFVVCMACAILMACTHNPVEATLYALAALAWPVLRGIHHKRR